MFGMSMAAAGTLRFSIRNDRSTSGAVRQDGSSVTAHLIKTVSKIRSIPATRQRVNRTKADSLSKLVKQ
jgi:hypothetical protein